MLPAELRSKVIDIESRMLEMPQVDLPVTDRFSDGLYARELRIPAGVVLTGRIHKFRNLNILSQGDMSILTEDGIQRVQAPFTVVSPPGTKRIAYAHTDCVWTTILATEETDPEAIEAHFTTNDEQTYLAFVQSLEGK